MSKDNKIVGMVFVAASLASVWAFAQPALPSGGSTPMSVAPQPAAPLLVAPLVPSNVGTGVSARNAAAPGAEGGAQRNTLRLISEKQAELNLLKLQAEIDKFKKPAEDAPKKEDAPNIAAALEVAKREQAQPASVVEQGPTVTLLATYGMPEVPGASFAELKVGDLLVNAKVGDRLPSGHYVTAIHFDSVEISKNKKAKRGSTLFISATDTASVYASRPKSGQASSPAADGVSAPRSSGAPLSLPPMPTR